MVVGNLKVEKKIQPKFSTFQNKKNHVFINFCQNIFCMIQKKPNKFILTDTESASDTDNSNSIIDKSE